jgi:hypothetical protein
VVVGDFGSGLNSASGQSHHLGGRVAGALGPLRVAVGAGAWDVASGTSVQLGGMLAARVLGRPAGPLTGLLVAGAGRVRAGPSDTSATYLTVPVGVALIRPAPGAGSRGITPWLFPRIQLDRVTFADARATQLGAGLSAGVSADLTGRLGVHGALDWLHQFRWSGPAITLEGGERVTMGVGAYWRVSSAP